MEIKPSSQGYFEISVKPNAKKTEVVSFDSSKNVYKINVAEDASEGKANKEIIKFFKKEYKWNVEIKSGTTSHKKLLRILEK